jgi:DNA-binding CsgD family transcriptional regulator
MRAAKWSELLPLGLAPKLLDAIPYPAFVIGPAFSLRYANAAARERFGLTDDALERLGRELATFPTAREFRDRYYRRWLEGESPRPVPLRWTDGRGAGSFLGVPFPSPAEAGVYGIVLVPDAASGDPPGPRWLVSAELETEARRDASAIRELDARRRAHEGFSRLTTREWEIARRIAIGDRVSLVAEDLRISPNPVRNHLKAIFRKLGVGSQPELVRSVRTLVRSRGTAGE